MKVLVGQTSATSQTVPCVNPAMPVLEYANADAAVRAVGLVAPFVVMGMLDALRTTVRRAFPCDLALRRNVANSGNRCFKVGTDRRERFVL
jgi:hypothetical protein